MQRKLLDILACPMDKHYPLEMLEFSVREPDVVVNGILLCSQCGRYYPIIDEIPVMLPDNLRNKKEDIGFLEKWGSRLPESVVRGGEAVEPHRVTWETLKAPAGRPRGRVGGIAQPGRATGSSDTNG